MDFPKKSEGINRIGLSRLPVCLILPPSLEMKLLNLVSLETHSTGHQYRGYILGRRGIMYSERSHL